MLARRRAEQTLGVEYERVGDRIVGAPHSQSTSLLLVARAEYVATVEERVVECVRLAVARVAEYGHALDELVVLAGQGRGRH